MDLPGPWPNGFYVGNFTGMPLYFVAYDANQLMLGPFQIPPLIESPAKDQANATNLRGDGWFLSSDQIGRTDRIYVLAFFDTDQFKPPPAIDIKQSTSGGGGSISIFGFGGGASVSVSEFYSAPAAAAVMVLGQTPRGDQAPLIASGLEVTTDQIDPKHPLVLKYHDFNGGMMMAAWQYSVANVRPVLRLENIEELEVAGTK